MMSPNVACSLSVHFTIVQVDEEAAPSSDTEVRATADGGNCRVLGSATNWLLHRAHRAAVKVSERILLRRASFATCSSLAGNATSAPVSGEPL